MLPWFSLHALMMCHCKGRFFFEKGSFISSGRVSTELQFVANVRADYLHSCSVVFWGKVSRTYTHGILLSSFILNKAVQIKADKKIGLAI